MSHNPITSSVYANYINPIFEVNEVKKSGGIIAEIIILIYIFCGFFYFVYFEYRIDIIGVD